MKSTILQSIPLNVLILIQLKNKALTTFNLCSLLLSYGFAVEDGTLYVSLKNMCKAGLVKVDDFGLYSLTDEGNLQSDLIKKRMLTFINQDLNQIDFVVRNTSSIPSDVPEIIIVPMSSSENTMIQFENSNESFIKQVQEKFFWGSIYKEEENRYVYEYGSRGINALRKTLLLFRIKGFIIASAQLEYDDKINKRMYLIPGSIRTFKPISENDISQILDSNFKFIRNKQRLPIEILPEIMKLL